MRLLRHLEIVVIKSDRSEADRDQQNDPHIAAARVGPQQRRDDKPGQDHQPAHGRRAFLSHEMRLRAILADRLALALAQAQQGNHRRAEQKNEQQRRHRGAGGPERDVAKQVERLEMRAVFRKQGEHRLFSVLGWRRQPRADRLDHRSHAAAERTFDADNVMRADRRDDGRGQGGGIGGVGAAPRRRQFVP